MVHPGALGLSGLHSLCYSLPVITHDNADSHMPEFSVLENGVNSLLYKEHHGLEYGLLRALSVDYETYDGIVQQCKERVRIEYNTNIMAKNFREAIYAA